MVDRRSAGACARLADQQVADEQRVPGGLGDTPSPPSGGADRRRRSRSCAISARGRAASASMSASSSVELRRAHRRRCCPTRRWSSVSASRTMNLSLGERPVMAPVRHRQGAVGGQLRLRRPTSAAVSQLRRDCCRRYGAAQRRDRPAQP